MFEKILLACDGSAHALRSAEKALELAKLNPQSFISVVYVVDGNTSKSDVLAYGELLEEKRHQKLNAIEEKFELEKIHFETRILKGEPGPEIVKLANEENYDLVVVGSRGLNAFQEMVLGSVSHKVAKRADCPVLIVK